MPKVCSPAVTTASLNQVTTPRKLVCLAPVGLALLLSTLPAVAVDAAVPASSQPVLTRTQLTFATAVSASGQAFATPSQVVFLEQDGSPGVAWRAEVTAAWLQVEPERGTAPSRIAIGIRGASVPVAAGTQTSDVVIRIGSGPGATVRVVHVTLNVLGRNSQPPFGFFDVPAGNITLTNEPVRLFGWALDDIAATDVEVCRDCTPEEIPGPGCSDTSKALMGHAIFIDGARPDVVAAFPATPRNTFSSWSFPIDPADIPRSRGPLAIYAIAHDVDGHATLLGTRTVTVDAVARTQGRWPRRYPAMLVATVVVLLAFHALIGLCCLRRKGRTALSSGDAASRVSRFEWLAVTTVMTVFLLFNGFRLGGGLGYDELYTASRFVIGVPLWKAAASIGVFNNHIAYSLLAGLSVRLLGSAEWAVRLPALLLGAATVFMLWRLARMLFDGPTALGAAALLAVSPFFAEWSRSARGYTGLAVMTLISTHAFLLLARSGSRRAAAVHTGSTVLAIYFHLYGAWLLVVQYACYAVLVLRARWSTGRTSGIGDRGMRQMWVGFPLIGFLALLLYVPVILPLIHVALARGRAPLVAAFPWDVYRAMLGEPAWPLAAGAGAVALVGLARLWRQRLAFACVILLLTVPMGTMWLLVRPADLYPRFFVFAAPLLLSLIAGGVFAAFTRVRTRRSVAATVAVLVPATAVAVVLLARWLGADLSYAPDPGYREALRRPVDDRAAAFAIGGDSEMFRYYLGPQMAVLYFAADLDARLREFPRVVVAYHNMSWNSQYDREMLSLLRRRCRADDRGAVTMFRCD